MRIDGQLLERTQFERERTSLLKTASEALARHCLLDHFRPDSVSWYCCRSLPPERQMPRHSRARSENQQRTVGRASPQLNGSRFCPITIDAFGLQICAPSAKWLEAIDVQLPAVATLLHLTSTALMSSALGADRERHPPFVCMFTSFRQRISAAIKSRFPSVKAEWCTMDLKILHWNL
jgi:hypothetical protein